MVGKSFAEGGDVITVVRKYFLSRACKTKSACQSFFRSFCRYAVLKTFVHPGVRNTGGLFRWWK